MKIVFNNKEIAYVNEVVSFFENDDTASVCSLSKKIERSNILSVSENANGVTLEVNDDFVIDFVKTARPHADVALSLVKALLGSLRIMGGSMKKLIKKHEKRDKWD